MLKLKLVVIFLFLTITYNTIKDAYKQLPPRTAYFTAWDKEAIKENQILKTLTAELQKPVNGGFAISATPPRTTSYNQLILL